MHQGESWKAVALAVALAVLDGPQGTKVNPSVLAFDFGLV